ncbi:serine hydrolase domain-containing protein [Falsiruegeria litorea]|uniref:Beta-lactamase family protein n=1 Tax=Falsiruegeria litorea TaxID=1280831 RepID=A0ABS5WRJ3_9RHOB|nr:serine hydrolase [Falsiruegeria litorea]MBT3141740.1 beta-lactamase family protein [Falsiruegeria litorea]MBT8170083.1 beta-lactamase family protein [Falsiruegeria litorea]
MRAVGKWIGRILVALVLAAVVVGVWKREEIKRLWAVNSLFSEEKIVNNFSHMDAAFLTRTLSRGDGPTSELPYGSKTQLPAETAQWIEDRSVTSLLVMKDGAIRYEEYFLGTSPDDRRISWSIAKSYLSALFGVLMEEGAIASLDDPVIKYAPLLKGSAYEAATIRNVLNMASGVTFDEDYLDYDSDINRMGRVVALGGALDDFAASITESFATPGDTWQYVSIDTHVVGMVVRGATGRSVSELLEQKILIPLGLEQDGYYVTDGAGVAFVLGGLNFTTRDFARFGQMILQNGTYGGTRIVPEAWIAESTHASAPTQPGKIGYGYQWWIPVGAHQGEFLGRGVYGQYLYFDQQRGVLITTTGADRKFRDEGVSETNIEMFRLIAKNL